MERRNFFKLLGVLALSPLAIIPKERFPKLTRVPWKLESVPELISCHGMDAEEELTKMMAEQIRKEIDEEILIRVNKEANRIHKKQGSQKANFVIISRRLQ